MAGISCQKARGADVWMYSHELPSLPDGIRIDKRTGRVVWAQEVTHLSFCSSNSASWVWLRLCCRLERPRGYGEMTTRASSGLSPCSAQGGVSTREPAGFGNAVAEYKGTRATTTHDGRGSGPTCQEVADICSSITCYRRGIFSYLLLHSRLGVNNIALLPCDDG